MQKKSLSALQRSFANTNTPFKAGVLVFFVSLIGLAMAPLIVNAAGAIPTMQDVAQAGGLPQVSLAVFLIKIIQIFFALLGVIAVFLLMYGGWIWMSSQGDPAKVEKAKQIIYNTIIGLIIIFSAYAITAFLMAWLTGMGGGGGGGTNIGIPGGYNDPGRGGIGGGPIESVYPAPNATGVPINTRIVVTFKQAIAPETICAVSTAEGVNKGTCSGSLININNITIGKASTTAIAYLTPADAGTDVSRYYEAKFSTSSYATTKVSQASPTDFKTFVFETSAYLGDDDRQIRTFMVTLGNGIKATSTNDSIFKGQRNPNYSWVFKTNGVLDFNPPEVENMGLYPTPDDQADSYTVLDTQSDAGSVVTTTVDAAITSNLETSPTINGVPFFGTEIKDIDLIQKDGTAMPVGYLKISAVSLNSIATGPIVCTSTVEGGAGQYIQFTNDEILKLGANYSITGVCQDIVRCFPISGDSQVILTGSGLTINSTGSFKNAKGTTWTFNVTPAISGAVLTLRNGTTDTNFIFASSSYKGDKITKTVKGTDGKNIDTDYYTVKSGVAGADNATYAKSLDDVLKLKVGNLIYVSSTPAGKVVVSAKASGKNSLSLITSNPALLILDPSNNPTTLMASLSGTDRSIGWTPNGNKDLFNNSKIRVTFNKPINPINIETFIKVNILGATNPVPASTTLTNQYRTVELTPTIPCGINACGKPIFCWIDPAEANVDEPAISVQASTTIIASSLRTCVPDGNKVGTEKTAGNEWCSQFGGKCNGGNTCDNSVNYCRCKIQTTGLYYPQAVPAPDGISDLSGNSFNGNFSTSTNVKEEVMGNAEGKSGISGGGSGYNNPYIANDLIHDIQTRTTAPNPFVFSYKNDNEKLKGDNFTWSFFISNQIDKASPLLTTLNPKGDQAYGTDQTKNETFRDPVELFFNTIMSYATLKPGWGYGSTTTGDWFTRYLALDTITKGANPVGYWVGSSDMDTGSISLLGAYEGANDGLADFTRASIFHNPFDQAVSYGPLVGQGVESITQNCFLPGNGPQNAGDTNAGITGVPANPNKCYYSDANGGTAGCVTDAGLTSQVVKTNPASYGYMNCKDIQGTSEGSTCDPNGKKCYLNMDSTTSSSWIITKDHPTATAGRTGCCFGVCK